MTRLCAAIVLTAGGLLAGCPSAESRALAPAPDGGPAPIEEDGGTVEDAGPQVHGSTIAGTATLPLLEASGLARHGDRFYAVGDETAEVITFGIGADGAFVDIVTHDLSTKTNIGSRGSQWEGVAVDDDGQVVVLSEDGALVVFDAKLERSVGASTIDVVAVRKAIGASDDPNSQGEGLVLLGRGHVLVANEKSPPALVELGPAGEAPLGFTRGAKAGTFTAPAKLVPLASWTFQDEAALPDVSDLAIADDGSLWALTQEGKRAVRFEDTISAASREVKILERLELPAELAKAEGLAFAGRDVVTALDLGRGIPNLFRLSVTP